MGVPNPKLTRRHFSAKVYLSYLSYLRKHYPDLDLNQLCGDAGLSLQYLEDEFHWVSTTFDHRFTELAIERTGEESLAYSVGAQPIDSSTVGRVLANLFSKTITVRMMYQLLSKILNHFSRVTKLTLVDHTPGFAHFQFFPLPNDLDAQEKEALKKNFINVAANTMAHLAAIPNVQNLPNARVDYTVEQGAGGFSVYEIKVYYEEENRLRKNMALLVAAGITIGILFTAKIGWSERMAFAGIILASWVVALRVLSFSIMDKHARALRALNDSDQRYANLQAIKEKLKSFADATQRFVPWEFLQLLGSEDVSQLKFGQNVQREASVLFFDIRRFSTLSETLSPDELFVFLNRIWTRLVPVIEKHSGIIDQVRGDGILAIFPQSPADAIRAAIDIHGTLADQNREFERLHRDPIQVGVGINVGKVTIGTVGNEDQMRITVLGDAVNVAARLEEMNKSLSSKILVSKKAFDDSGLADSVLWRNFGPMSIRGRLDPIEVIQIYECEEPKVQEAYQSTSKEFFAASELLRHGKKDEARLVLEAILIRNPDDRGAAHLLTLLSQEKLEAAKLAMQKF